MVVLGLLNGSGRRLLRISRCDEFRVVVDSGRRLLRILRCGGFRVVVDFALWWISRCGGTWLIEWLGSTLAAVDCLWLLAACSGSLITAQ